jgi:hypothetical protein
MVVSSRAAVLEATSGGHSIRLQGFAQPFTSAIATLPRFSE